MAAMKFAEAKRTGDDGWLRMAPPLMELSEEQKTRFAAELDTLFGTGSDMRAAG